MTRLRLFAFFLLLPVAAAASEAATALMREIRCPVCQGESIAESNAPVARDLRAYVETRMAEGASAEAVREELRQRYGDFILMRPAASGATLVLWLAPLLLIGVGAAIWVALTRRAGRTAPAPALSPEESEALDRLRGS